MEKISFNFFPEQVKCLNFFYTDFLKLFHIETPLYVFLVVSSCLIFVNVRGRSCVVLMNVFVQTKQIMEKMMVYCYWSMETWPKKSMASLSQLSTSSKGKIDSCLKMAPVYIFFYLKKQWSLYRNFFVTFLLVLVLLFT